MRINWLALCGWLWLFCGVACGRSPSYEERVTDGLNQLFTTERLECYKCIVLIPNGGCTGCVLQAEDYFLRAVDDAEILFIFTNYLSRKDMKIKLGSRSLDKPNVWLDEENRLYFPQFTESLYPCVIWLDKGAVGRFANLDEVLE